MKNIRYSIKEFAERYSTTRQRVWNMCRRKELKFGYDKKGFIEIPDSKYNIKIIS